MRSYPMYAIGIGTGLFLLGLLVGNWLPIGRPIAAAEEMAYVYSSSGIIPASMEYGLPLNDLEFLANFAGPLVRIPYGEPIPDELTLLPTLRSSLQAEYEEKHLILQNYFPHLSNDKLLLIFLVLRVNGSLPTYEPYPYGEPNTSLTRW